MDYMARRARLGIRLGIIVLAFGPVLILFGLLTSEALVVLGLTSVALGLLGLIMNGLRLKHVARSRR
jgi:hypothetical protein